MRIIDFYQDNNVSFITGGHKHAQNGWVNTACPFCVGNAGFHLGYNVDEDFFTCWRCGGKSHLQIIRHFANVSWRRAAEILKQYGGKSFVTKKQIILADETFLPSGTGDMLDRHKAYLEGRDFDADELERIWELRGTGKKGSYRNRIVAPIYRRGELISYQARDITGKADIPYKACPKEGEVVEHKNSLYGLDQVRGDSIVIVEGIVDVWRLGIGAVATFGIKFRQPQVALMRSFKNRFIFFDSDPQAIEQAEKLYFMLSSFPGYTELVDIEDSDPGDLSQRDADDIMVDLIGKR